MYFDFEDYRPDTPTIGRVISWREGVLLSINGRVAATVGATLTTAEGDGGPEPEAASCH